MVTHYQLHSFVQNGSGKGDSYPLSCTMYIQITDDLNYPLKATGVACYVQGAWVNSLSYADDMVLPIGVTCTHGNSSSDTLGGPYHS